MTLLMWYCLITVHLVMSPRLPQDRKITAHCLVEVKQTVTYSLYILYICTYISLYILTWTPMLKPVCEKSFPGRKAYEEISHLGQRYKVDTFMLCKNIGSMFLWHMPRVILILETQITISREECIVARCRIWELSFGSPVKLK